MDRIRQLYDAGDTYLEYIDKAEHIGWVEHLHYLHKMELSEEESKLVKEISCPIKLLVFCERSCDDCRTFLAILENIRWANPFLQYSIVDRGSNKDIMEEMDQDCKVPLVIDIHEDKPRVVYSEFSEPILDNMVNSDPNDIDLIRQNYRKGLFKKEVIHQILKIMEARLQL